MENALIITAPGAIRAPLVGTPALLIRGDSTVHVSDGFSGSSGPLAGRSADSEAGGQPLVWIGSGIPALTVNGSGRAVASTSGGEGTYFAYFEIPGQGASRDVSVSTKIAQRFSGDFNIDMLRDTTSSSGSKKLRTRVLTTDAGYVIGYEGTIIPGSDFAYTIGKTITTRYNTGTGKLGVEVDGVEVVSITYRPTVAFTGKLFGMSGSAYTAGAVDSFAVSEVIL